MSIRRPTGSCLPDPDGKPASLPLRYILGEAPRETWWETNRHRAVSIVGWVAAALILALTSFLLWELLFPRSNSSDPFLGLQTPRTVSTLGSVAEAGSLTDAADVLDVDDAMEGPGSALAARRVETRATGDVGALSDTMAVGTAPSVAEVPNTGPDVAAGRLISPSTPVPTQTTLGVTSTTWSGASASAATATSVQAPTSNPSRVDDKGGQGEGGSTTTQTTSSTSESSNSGSGSSGRSGSGGSGSSGSGSGGSGSGSGGSGSGSGKSGSGN